MRISNGAPQAPGPRTLPANARPAPPEVATGGEQLTGPRRHKVWASRAHYEYASFAAGRPAQSGAFAPIKRPAAMTTAFKWKFYHRPCCDRPLCGLSGPQSDLATGGRLKQSRRSPFGPSIKRRACLMRKWLRNHSQDRPRPPPRPAAGQRDPQCHHWPANRVECPGRGRHKLAHWPPNGQLVEVRPAL